MRLRTEQLASHLQRNDLAPVYFVSGDEPLQKLECVDLIRATARSQGYSERVVFNVDKGFDWDSILQAGSNLSLFSDRRIIELRMSSPKPGKEGGKVLQDYAAQASNDNLLIISSDKADRTVQNNKWFKSLEKIGVIMQVWPVNPAQLAGWIQNRFQQHDKRISMDAARLIAQRVEGNLLAARQEIEKLCLLVTSDDIDVDDVISAVADSSRFDVFSMIESAYLGKPDRTLMMLYGLRKEGVEPLALFGAIMWEFRRTCTMAWEKHSGSSLDSIFNAYRIWDQKKPALNAVLQRHTCSKLLQLLYYCAQIDKKMKSADKEQAWDQLTILLLALAGVKTQAVL